MLNSGLEVMKVTKFQLTPNNFSKIMPTGQNTETWVVNTTVSIINYNLVFNKEP